MKHGIICTIDTGPFPSLPQYGLEEKIDWRYLLHYLLKVLAHGGDRQCLFFLNKKSIRVLLIRCKNLIPRGRG